MNSWQSKFKEKFSIESSKSSVFKIIVGQEPYKQKLGGINLKVDVDEKGYNGIYNDFGHVAFLVTKWIKMQDSLEMIFNLLFGGYCKSLEVLSYLRSNNIGAVDFAEYLYKEHNIILVNRYDSFFKEGEKGHWEKKDNKDEIEDLIGNIKKHEKVEVLLLYVGNKASKCNFEQADKSAQIIHPSGNNLNQQDRQEEYYKVWYEFNDEYLENIQNGLSLSDFRII